MSGPKAESCFSADNPFFSKRHSQAIKQRMRLAALGRRASEETKEKMRLSRLGKRRKRSPTYGQDCPNCQSTNIRKCGNIKNNRQPLKCMDCNKIHCLPIYNIINPKLLCLKSYGQRCPKCGGKNVRRKGDIVNNKQGFLCDDCHRYSALLIYSIIDQKRAASDDLEWLVNNYQRNKRLCNICRDEVQVLKALDITQRESL